MATTWTCLIRIKSKDEERSHLIEKTSFTIGRAEDAGFPLTEPSVSRTHLTVELRGPFVYITDMKSGNGTRVNGQKVNPGVAIAVTPNDVIQLGRSTIDFQILSIPKPVISTADSVSKSGIPVAATPAPVESNSKPQIKLDLPPGPKSVAVSDAVQPAVSVSVPSTVSVSAAPSVAPSASKVPPLPTAPSAFAVPSLASVVAKVSEHIAPSKSASASVPAPAPTPAPKKVEAKGPTPAEVKAQVAAPSPGPVIPAIPKKPEPHSSLVDLHNQKQALELEIAQLKQTLALAASEERLKYAAQADKIINEAHQKIAKDYEDASIQIDNRMRIAQEKLFAMNQDAETRARQTLQDAQDEAVRIRAQASEDTRKMHQEALQRNSETLSTLQEKFQKDMSVKRDEMIARAKAEGERERAKMLKERADEASAIEKTIASLNATLAPLHEKQKAAIEELKRLDDLTTQARRELERNGKQADEVRQWVAKTDKARVEKAEIERALGILQSRLNDAQSKIDDEIAAMRQKALLEFENEKKHSQGDIAKTKLKALEDLQKRIQEEERKYGETLHLRAIELAQKLSARLVPALPELIQDPDLAGARMKEAIEAATNETILNGKSSFTAPIVEGLGAVPTKTRTEQEKRKIQIAVAVAIALVVIGSFFGQDIYNWSKKSEAHSYASEKMQERQEAAIFHPDRDPRYGTTYHESYTENVLFMKGYYEAKTDSLNQQKWLLRLNDLDMLRPMHLTEDDIVAYTSKENALILRLAGLQSKIDGMYAEQGIKTMADAEAIDVADMKHILKSEANYKKIRALEREFVTQLIH